MKKIDEFKINSMLEDLPELQPSEKTGHKIELLLSVLQTANKSFINQHVKTWMAIAASIIMFVIGYSISFNTEDSKTALEIASQSQYTRQLLLKNTTNKSSPSDRLASIQYLVGSQPNEHEVVKELIYLIELESNENVKLALFELISSYSDLIEVQNLLEKQLAIESNPLISITIINTLSKIKAKKGMQILKEYWNENNIHPLVKNHLKYLNI